MSKNRILTIEQIKESENKFISKNSEDQLLVIAGRKIGNFLLEKFKGKSVLFVCHCGFVPQKVSRWLGNAFLVQIKVSRC